MTGAENNERPRSLERAGFVLLAALLLAPIVAQGLWLPLEHVFGAAGSAGQVTVAALVIAAIVALSGQLGRGRALPLGLGAAVAGLAAAGLSLGLAGLLSLLAVAAASAGLAAGMAPRLPTALDGLARRHPRLTALYIAVALLGIVSTARVSVFIGDPSQEQMQAIPGEPFLLRHSCLTAYVGASALARQGVENLYDDAWWAGAEGLPPLPEGAVNPYSPFHPDNFSYPPTFLMVVAPLVPFDGDFLAQRALWFGLNGLLFAIALWGVARWIDDERAHRVLLLAPLFLASVPILVTLQIGNFHLATLAISALGMVALDQGRAAKGGMLLATAIVSKISPGVLGIVLLVRRRFRMALATAISGALLFAAALVWFGADPLVSFVTYALPRLGSGAAFPHIAAEGGIRNNYSPFGIPFALQALGVEVGDPWAVGRALGRVFTVVVVLLAIAAGLGQRSRREQAMAWLSLLTVAGLQSPFSAGYVTIGTLWATILLAVEVRRAWQVVGLALLWVLMLALPPDMPMQIRVTQCLLGLVATLGFSSWLILRRPRPTGEP